MHASCKKSSICKPASWWLVVLVTAALCTLGAAPSVAHHGQDFLLVRAASVPHAGELFIIPRLDFADEGEEDEIEFEPTLLYGFTSRFAGEVHVHIAKEGSEDFELESTAPTIHFRLNSPENPWAVGLSFEYEISHVSEHADVAEGIFSLSHETDRLKLAFNLFVEEEQESGAAVEWAYGAAVRRQINPGFDLGIEVLGNLEEPGDGEALIGFYLEPKTRTGPLSKKVPDSRGHEETRIDRLSRQVPDRLDFGRLDVLRRSSFLTWLRPSPSAPPSRPRDFLAILTGKHQKRPVPDLFDRSSSARGSPLFFLTVRNGLGQTFVTG